MAVPSSRITTSPQHQSANDATKIAQTLIEQLQKQNPGQATSRQQRQQVLDFISRAKTSLQSMMEQSRPATNNIARTTRPKVSPRGNSEARPAPTPSNAVPPPLPTPLWTPSSTAAIVNPPLHRAGTPTVSPAVSAVMDEVRNMTLDASKWQKFEQTLEQTFANQCGPIGSGGIIVTTFNTQCAQFLNDVEQVFQDEPAIPLMKSALQQIISSKDETVRRKPIETFSKAHRDENDKAIKISYHKRTPEQEQTFLLKIAPKLQFLNSIDLAKHWKELDDETKDSFFEWMSTLDRQRLMFDSFYGKDKNANPLGELEKIAFDIFKEEMQNDPDFLKDLSQMSPMDWITVAPSLISKITPRLQNNPVLQKHAEEHPESDENIQRIFENFQGSSNQ